MSMFRDRQSLKSCEQNNTENTKIEIAKEKNLILASYLVLVMAFPS